MPHTDPLIKKVNATLLALKLVVHHNLSFLQFEGNSKPMINNLQSLSPIVLYILLEVMPIVSYSLKSLSS